MSEYLYRKIPYRRRSLQQTEGHLQMKLEATRALLTILISLFLCRSLWAAEKRVVTATGIAAITNTTAEEARSLALKGARLNAIEEVCGTRIQAEAFVSHHKLTGNFIHAVSYGHIVSEEIVRWDVDVLQESPKHIPEISYHVTIRATVQREEGEPDPFYNVTVRLNKKVFQSGEEMIIYVRCTRPGYITVLNFAADDRVVLLFPNRIRRDSQVEADREYQIPSAADRDGVLKLQVSNLPGHMTDTELIKVVATREPFDLLSGLSMKGEYGMMDTVNFAVTEIARLISSIPLKHRAEATVMYQIVSPE